jgi:hypothetical protein
MGRRVRVELKVDPLDEAEDIVVFVEEVEHGRLVRSNFLELVLLMLSPKLYLLTLRQ